LSGTGLSAASEVNPFACALKAKTFRLHSGIVLSKLGLFR